MKVLLSYLLALYFLLYKIGDFDKSIGKFMIVSFLIYGIYALFAYKIYKAKKINYKFIFLAAALIILPFLITKPHFSNDLYRYMWDGWLLKSGVNPLLFAPKDPHLSSFQSSELYKLVDWKDKLTPYPPLAQIIFSVTHTFYATFGISGAKLVMIFPVVLSSLFLYKVVDKKLSALFILNPLLLLEIAQNAHIDSFVILFLLLSIYCYFTKKVKTSSLFLCLAFLTKIYPVVFFPFLTLDLIRKKKYMPALEFVAVFAFVSLISYSPFLQDSFLPILRYLTLPGEQEFNASIYRYLYEILGHFTPNSKILAELASGFLFVSATLFLLRKKLTFKILLLAGIVYLAFSPIVFPWYTLFLIPLVILEARRSRSFSIFFLLIFSQFILTLTYFEPGKKPLRETLLNLEYFTFLLLLLFYSYRERMINLVRPSKIN